MQNIMMKVFFILLSICLTTIHSSHFFFSELSYHRELEYTPKLFPWVVVIENATVQFYGTIVHERAVLTLAVIDIRPSYFKFEVHYDVYFIGKYPEHKDLKNRHIMEYHVIESDENNYKQNLAILIVDEPFPSAPESSASFRVIHPIQASDDINYASCITLSLRLFLQRTSERDLPRNMFVSTVNAIKGKFDKDKLFFIDIYENYTLHDDKEREEYLGVGTSGSGPIMSMVAAPVVCHSYASDQDWIQVSIINWALFLKNDSNLEQKSLTRNLSGIPIENIIEKILNLAKIQ